MRIWNTSKLARELAEGSLSEWDKTKYYIAGSIVQILLATVVPYLLGFGESTIDSFVVISHLVTAIIIYVGSMSVFKSCNKYKKAGFLETIIILNLPLSIKIELMYWVLFLSIAFYSAVTTSFGDYWYLFAYFVFPVKSIVFFILVKYHVDKAYS